VASKYLATKRPGTVGFIGCGVQARSLHAAHKALYGSFRSVMADVSPEAAARFAKEVGGHAAPADQAASCDIVCTLTPSRKPVVFRSYIGIGTHINAMGADAPGKQELEPQILQEATVVLDDFAQATESGEVNVPLHEGRYRKEQIHGTLGEVVIGRKPGRQGMEITVFDSTGLALQDLALARVAYDEARRRGIGLDVELVG
jgi:ornithine cyclodeaminase/alanine dehydrogenase